MSTSPKNVYRNMLAVMLGCPGIPFSALAGQEIGQSGSHIGPADVMSVIFNLLIVIAVIASVAFVISRLKGSYRGSSSFVNIISAQAIGPKERILLVEVADKQLLLGVTASQIQTLHVFDERVIEVSNQAGRTSFAERLKSAMRGDRK